MFHEVQNILTVFSLILSANIKAYCTAKQLLIGCGECSKEENWRLASETNVLTLFWIVKAHESCWQKHSKKPGLKYIKLEMLIKQPEKQLNRVVLSQGSTINLTGRSRCSYCRGFEEASFNLHTLGPHPPFLLLLPLFLKRLISLCMRCYSIFNLNRNLK